MSLFKNKKKKVLVVDDHSLVVDMLCGVLEGVGFNVITANSASQALHQMHLYPCDVVLMDVQLPDESGLKLLEKFKKRYARIPVIMITGMGLDETLIKSAMDLGATAFLSKGAHLQHILKAINDAADLPKAA